MNACRTLAFDIGGSKIEFARVACRRHGRASRDAADAAYAAGTISPTPITTLVDRRRRRASGSASRSPARSIPRPASPRPPICPRSTATASRPRLAEQLGMPVRVGNDADCFALAEAHVGAGRGLPIVFAVILGTGVGGGLVDRRTHRARRPWRHRRMGPRPGARPTPSRRAAFRSSPAVAARSAASTSMVRRAAWSGSIEALAGDSLHAARRSPRPGMRGDAGRDAHDRDLVDLLTGPLSMIVNTLGPSVIPVGGGLSSETVLLDADRPGGARPGARRATTSRWSSPARRAARAD